MTKEDLRLLVVLKVMAEFAAKNGRAARASDLVSPGDDLVNKEWNTLGVGSVYPHRIHLPQLDRVCKRMVELGLVTDEIATRAKRSAPRFVLTPTGIIAGAMLGGDWRQWQTPEALAQAARDSA